MESSSMHLELYVCYYLFLPTHHKYFIGDIICHLILFDQVYERNNVNHIILYKPKISLLPGNCCVVGNREDTAIYLHCHLLSILGDIFN